MNDLFQAADARELARLKRQVRLAPHGTKREREEALQRFRTEQLRREVAA